jgi:16S rRNA (uracil1498-N3)-methyltransferase
MRFFVTEDRVCGDLIWLEPTDAQHVSRVLRMHPGEEITVCCGNGSAYLCALEQVGKTEVSARILSEEAFNNEPTAFVTVYAGLSKGDRFDYLIQKCVECGVSHIVPFTSQHCVVRLEGKDYEKKQQRYARIALEASKQCQRSRVVTVGEIVPFDKALAAAAQADCGLFLYEKEQQKSLSSVLKSAQGSHYSVVTGPEGGFSEKEAQLAQDAGLACVSIGPRILRCETAPVAALCAIMYETGNFDIGE